MDRDNGFYTRGPRFDSCMTLFFLLFFLELLSFRVRLGLGIGLVDIFIELTLFLIKAFLKIEHVNVLDLNVAYLRRSKAKVVLFLDTQRF